MKVFPLIDPNNPMRLVDLFVETPIDFEELWEQSEKIPLERSTVRVACIAHLVKLKREAGRPRDVIDIDALERIARTKGRGDKDQ